MKIELPVAGQKPEVQRYEGDAAKLAEDLTRVARGQLAAEIAPMAWPSKMDCPAWGIPIEFCETGAKLRQVKDTPCEGCYAGKGTFHFAAVQRKLRQSYEGLLNPEGLWTPAMIHQVRWYAKERFRWFHSGDLQGINHLRNIIRVCLETEWVQHWLPTRESRIVLKCKDEIPKNLNIRASGNRIDGPRPTWWAVTSVVVTEIDQYTCPTSVNGRSCSDHDCYICWDPETDYVTYLKH